MISRGHLTHMSILHQSCITIQFNQNQNSYHCAYFNCFLKKKILFQFEWICSFNFLGFFLKMLCFSVDFSLVN